MPYIITTKNTNADKLKAVSHSKLYTYTKCPFLYKLKHIDKTLISEKKSYFELGSLVHRVYEIHYQSGLSILDSFEQAKTEFIHSLRIDIELVNQAIEGYEKLSFLASEECVDKEQWIRNKEGEIYKKPSMSIGWKNKANELGITNINMQIKQQLLGTNPEYADLDIADIITEAKQLCSNYKLPSWINCIDPDYVEFPISQLKETVIINPVLLNEDTYFTGVIDFVGYTNTGQVVIGDHKTDNEPPPTPSKVEAKPQLNRYAWAWKQLTGTLPNFLVIHHVRSGTWVAAPVNPSYVEKAYQDMLSISKAIDNEIFYMRNPDEYDSPCWKCEALKVCWPKLVLERQ